MTTKELEAKLGHVFKDRSLLETALTHSSYANEKKGRTGACNERMEFLGDAVLGFLVAEYLYGAFPDLPEGKMTRLRAELVCEKSLDAVAKKLSLGKYLLLGHGEEQGGGRTRPSIIADATEAVLAALYLDGGMELAGKFVRDYIISACEAAGSACERDYKTELQEWAQRSSDNTLEYRLVSESGPDHAKNFCVEVLLNGRSLASGSGRSKKDAEQAAASTALEGID